jgi:hypothetical protein
MAFCPNCGTQLGSANAKFCANCGSQFPQLSSGPATQTQQVAKVLDAFEEKIRSQEPNVIGIVKSLDKDEKLVTQSMTQTHVLFVKEAHIKKILGEERKEVPLSLSTSFFYLTNRRLIFLKLFELSASELGQGNNMLAGAAGTFYELPLTAITGVDMRPVKLNKNDEARFLTFFQNDMSKFQRPALEIIYDEKAATGRARDYMESMLQRGIVSKLWGKVEMVYDKIFVLGEQAVALQPVLSDFVRTKTGMR